MLQDLDEDFPNDIMTNEFYIDLYKQVKPIIKNWRLVGQGNLLLNYHVEPSFSPDWVFQVYRKSSSPEYTWAIAYWNQEGDEAKVKEALKDKKVSLRLKPLILTPDIMEFTGILSNEDITVLDQAIQAIAIAALTLKDITKQYKELDGTNYNLSIGEYPSRKLICHWRSNTEEWLAMNPFMEVLHRLVKQVFPNWEVLKKGLN